MSKNRNGSTYLPTYSNAKSAIPVQQNDTITDEIRIFCFDLTFYNRTTQFLLSCTGVFCTYLIYGYMQELIFTLDGFKPFGPFLTLIQFGYYVIFGYTERRIEGTSAIRKIPMRVYSVLALLTLGTMGLSNSSLGYLNYPTQVIFKCCKLIPVLIGSMVIQKKMHGPIDFLAAIAMCIGLTYFTLVDAKISPNFNTIGVIMITGALLCDAMIGNVQEKAMREYKASNNEVVLYSYALGFGYLFIPMLLSGSLFSGLAFCSMYPIKTYGYAFLFSFSGYVGMQFVLTLVRTCGAPIAATVTTARKAVTIAISFLLFSKPFSMGYFYSGLIVLLGIYLNVYSKRNKMTFGECFAKTRNCFKLRISTKRSNDRILLNV